MRHLDFPVSAAAVRLHGREFHDQDFYAGTAWSAVPGTGPVCGAAPPQPLYELDELQHQLDGYPHRPGVAERFWTLVRWTSMCIGFAIAAATVVVWLARTDIQNAQWVDSVAEESDAELN